LTDRAPLVLVTGTDRFRVTERFGAERHRLAAAADTGTGVEDFEGADPQIVARALDAALTPSMFGSERVVALRDGVSEETLPLLAGYLEDAPSDATVLLMHVRSGRATKAYKDFEKAVSASGGQIVQIEGPPERERDLAVYVSSVAAERGVPLDRAAAAYLASHLGSDAGAIAGAIDKLAAAHPDATRIGADDAAELVGGPALAKTWDLTDAVDGGDRVGALRALRSLLAGDTYPLVVHAAIARHVRQLLAVSELAPASPKQIEADLGIKGYPAKKLYELARSIPQGAIVAAHREVASADIALRGASGLDTAIVLEILVARLSGLLGRRRGRR